MYYLDKEEISKLRLTKMLIREYCLRKMTKFLYYEFITDDLDVKMIPKYITEKKAIEKQKELLLQVNPDFLYESDDDALLDFKIMNFAPCAMYEWNIFNL